MHPRAGKPFVVGLLGGVGSGKSTVATLLGRHGCLVLDADALAREELEDPDVVRRIVDRFGPEVLDPDGTLSRQSLANRVFAVEGKHPREWLERLLHPRVERRILEALETTESAWVVLDVPLLLEGTLGDRCHLLVFVEASEAARQDRTVSHRGWQPDEYTRREAHQKTVDAKRARAHRVISNNGTLEQLETLVSDLVSDLRHRVSTHLSKE